MKVVPRLYRKKKITAVKEKSIDKEKIRHYNKNSDAVQLKRRKKKEKEKSS
ncbi:MAG: hypothetical protein ACOWWR_01475 [Eubacteriales bacterium]